MRVYTPDMLMKTMLTLGVPLATLLSLSSACSEAGEASGQPAAEEASAEPAQSGADEAEESWEAEGTITRIEQERGTITIQHGDVPGYMPAMTMPFHVGDESQFEGLSVDDRVSFRFVREEGGRHVIREIHAL